VAQRPDWRQGYNPLRRGAEDAIELRGFQNAPDVFSNRPPFCRDRLLVQVPSGDGTMRSAVGLARRRYTLGTLGILALFHVDIAGRQMPNVQHSTTELTAIPDWLYAPSTVRLALPPGVKLELMTMVVVSNDRRKEAAVIGLFRNRSRAMHGAALSLSYVGADGESILRSIPNAAYVSEVPVDGLLPFRLPLLAAAAVPQGVTAFEISIVEHVEGARRSLLATIQGGLSFRRQGDNAASVFGDVEIRDVDLPLPDSTRLFVTLVVEDKNGNLLDVLSGPPTSQNRLDLFRVRLDSFLPLASRVKESKLYVEGGS
jgi:hypothetical protein